MTDNADIKKVPFAGPEWVDLARTVLEELVAEHGEPGKSFSVYEAFTDAPAAITGPDSTTAAWHFHIVDKTVAVGIGKIDDTDMNVTVDYETGLPMARLVYTPEMIAQMREEAPKVEASQPETPAYLVELHNRMAEVTE